MTTEKKVVLTKENIDQVQAILAEKDVKLSKGVVKTVIDSFVQSIVANFLEGSDTQIAGFGKFDARKVEARERVNPSDRTKTVQRDSHIAPKFVPSRGLKNLLYEETREA